MSLSEQILQVFYQTLWKQICCSFRLLQFNLRVDGLKVCVAIYLHMCFVDIIIFISQNVNGKTLTDL